MNAGDLDIFSQPEAFEEYYSRISGRLKARVEQRVTFLNGAMERLGSLHTWAVRLGEPELARELSSHVDEARDALQSLHTVASGVYPDGGASGDPVPAGRGFAAPAPAAEMHPLASRAAMEPASMTADLAEPETVFREKGPSDDSDWDVDFEIGKPESGKRSDADQKPT